MRYLLSILLLCFGISELNAGVRIKDLARIQGSRQNQLIGYGVVVGLAGTGDSNPNVTLQTVANYMMRFGLSFSVTDIKGNNVAIVIVTADLPPFLRTGSKIDVNVASMADAKSLVGGVLMQTPLMGADGKVYAVAQGPLVVGGISAGGGGATLTKNHTTTAQISGGALVEREVPSQLITAGNTLDISLSDPDFTTATHMADALNARFMQNAVAIDSGTVRVNVPLDYQDPSRQIYFISQLENVEVEPDTVTKVIINERTGVIVANSRVKVSAVAIAHGNITISIAETPLISQPYPRSGGTTVTSKVVNTAVTEPIKSMYVIPNELPTVDKVATALNALGVSPRDMMTIFQSLKQAGALQAELVVR
jgi:flagellar P-ring protein FlgI